MLDQLRQQNRAQFELACRKALVARLYPLTEEFRYRSGHLVEFLEVEQLAGGHSDDGDVQPRKLVTAFRVA